MWILPKQLHTSAFVLDTKALGLDSEEFSQICEKSLTWRGKDSLSRTWLQRWRRENWMQHLCSRTLKPSHTESFLDAWTSSLGDSRVSLSRLLENVKQQKTHDTSSLSSQKESESADQQLSFSKMWKEYSVAQQETDNQFSNMSSEHWKAWVTEQRQEYSQRVKSAHRTRESGSSSLGWMTPIVGDAHLASNPEAAQKRLAEGKSTLSRQVEAKNWSTPTTRDYRDGMNLQKVIRKDGKHRLDSLPRLIQVETYGYPDQDNHSTNGKNRGSLNPNWVEQLMGMPVGWTDLGSWATESSLQPQQKPSSPSSND